MGRLLRNFSPGVADHQAHVDLFVDRHRGLEAVDPAAHPNHDHT
jgi:hypothetical protein